MAGSTDHFGLAFFDFGDNLSDTLNVQKEISRFTLIDRQLYGMASVFGDGIVNGWDIIDAGDLSINIAAGVGVFDKRVIESSFPETIDTLPANSTLNVYAVPGLNTELDRSSTFVVTAETRSDSLFLGIVVTGGTNIESIDITGRTLIGFKQIIADQIATQRYNGTTPKLDLEQEVQGELPTSKMADIDASKIVGGKIPLNVLPTIDHSQLKNIGTLTHPQLDSVVKSIQKDNLALLGEIASINIMKLMLHQKYSFPDVDKHFVNELAIIPGVSPDSYIDWDNTNAIVSKTDNCISGIPELPVDISSALQDVGNDLLSNNNFEIINIEWNTDSQFRNESSALTNVAINSGVRLSVDTVSDRIIENFDGVVGNPVPTYTGTLNEVNTTQVIYDSTHAQGDTSAKFETSNTKNLSFVKSFGQSQDWRAYDELVIYVKNLATTHAAVTLTLYDSQETVLATYQILGADEQTVDANGISGFSQKQIDISSIVRNDVMKMTFTTSNIVQTSEAFFIDTIYIRSNEFLLPQGNIRFRKSTTAPVIFNAVEYDSVIPAGCDLRVRVRVAGSLEALSNATYTSNLQSGEVFALPGNYIEIDITLIANSTKISTPLLTGVTLQILAPSEISGLQIQSSSAWKKGNELINISINEADDDIDTYVYMKNTNINNFDFINQNQITELDPTGFPVVGINSQSMPVTPAQSYVIINPPTTQNDPYNSRRRDIRGLYKPLSSYRQESGNYIIADTGNDRVMEVTPDGVFVRGYGSHNYDYDATNLYAMTSNYNPRLGVLFITLSKPADIRNFDLTLVRLILGNTQEIRLSNELDQIRLTDGTIITDRTPGASSDNPPANLTGDVDRVLTIFLSKDKRDILDSTTLAVSCAISTNIIDQIECFVGDFMYFGSFGIHRPIYANMSNETNIIIANSSILSESTAVIKTFPIIEFTIHVGELIDGQPLPLGLTFSYSDMLFSDIMLGSLQVIETLTTDGELQRKILVAGLVYNPNIIADSSSSSSSAGDVFSITLPALDDKKLLIFNGVVRLIDMVSGLITFEYICSDGSYPCDAFIDTDGNVNVAESSFVPQAGRITTLDSKGIGDGNQPPIIKLIEGGMFTRIWDIRGLKNSHLFVST